MPPNYCMSLHWRTCTTNALRTPCRVVADVVCAGTSISTYCCSYVPVVAVSPFSGLICQPCCGVANDVSHILCQAVDQRRRRPCRIVADVVRTSAIISTNCCSRAFCLPCLCASCLRLCASNGGAVKCLGVSRFVFLERRPQTRQGVTGLRMRCDHGSRCLRGHFSCLSCGSFGIRRDPISWLQRQILDPHGHRIGEPKRVPRIGLCSSKVI